MWYQKSADETMRELGTSKAGLKETEARRRVERYGQNRLADKKPKSPLARFLEQFKSVLVIILVAATAISLALGEVTDAVVILLIVVLNAALGYYQEEKAERAIEALKRMTVPKSKVIRSGRQSIIDSADIVPGDIIVLETGDRVPADCRVIEATSLKADESILTGESNPVMKTSETIRKAGLPVAEQSNMLFSGTMAVYGKCAAVVTSTGMDTEFGKIARMLQAPEEETPLQKRLDMLGRQMGMVVVFISAVVFALGYARGANVLDMFIVSVALAVAAVPEGLPASITIALSLGVHRMSGRNAIVRRLSSVETLGSTTVICTDKTGTLTMNEMTVRKVYVDGKTMDVTGEGYSLDGKFFSNGREAKMSNGLQLLLTVGTMCNDAQIDHQRIGDPTELALLVSACKGGVEDMRKKYSRHEEILFDPVRKMMSAAYIVQGKKKVYTKGAVESVLSACTHMIVDGKVKKLATIDRKKILDANRDFAGQALRVLAFAVKQTKSSEKLAEKGLVFVGLQGMMDPPRPDVKKSLGMCRSAGIKVVMITGDHADTAAAIGRELGIINDGGRVVTGAELDAMDEREFGRMVNEVNVYARVSPEHKVRITNALKAKGHVVAMTGDGVNDAPALKQSDIGIAMGVTGTDVTKEASDMILADDNFSSIVSAVEEGRGIYDNIRKVLAYMLSGNIAEVGVIAVSILAGLPLPLVAIQILWINLVTDGLPALALSMDSIDEDVMNRNPRLRKESVWSGLRPWFVETVIIMTGLTLMIFLWGLQESLAKAQTLAFTTVVIFEKYISFSCLSLGRPAGRRILRNRFLIIATMLTIALQLAILYTPFLNSVFGTVPLSPLEWLAILAAGASAFSYLEIYKWFRQELAAKGTERAFA